MSLDDMKEVDPITYIKEAKKKTGILWLGRFFSDVDLEDIFRITETKAYEYVIHSCSDWRKFIASCYSVSSCKNCGNEAWRAINGEKELLLEWMQSQRNREKANVDLSNNYKFFKYNKEKFNEDNVLITLVDTRKKKRLMVDGLHKAAALTMESLSP
jgi:hypothetical protein